MFRPSAAAAAAALCLVAQPAAAEPFENFVDLCMKTNVDGAAAGSIAKAAGWFQLPPEALGEEATPFEDTSLYLSADPAAMTADKAADLDVLMTGVGLGDDIFGIKDLRLDICAVGSLVAADVAALQSQLGALLGFGPERSGEDVPVWVFSPAGTGFQSRADLIDADDAAFAEAARREKILLATVMDSDGLSILVVGAVRPAR